MSNKVMVINLLRDITQQVDVRDPNGNLSTVQIMGRGRAELDLGYTVDPRYLSLNAKVLRVIAPSQENPAPDALLNTGDA